jgi:hypothetical protein
VVASPREQHRRTVYTWTTVQSQLGLENSVESLNALSKRSGASIAVTPVIRLPRWQSTRHGRSESSRSAKNSEHLSKRRRNNQGTGQSGTVDFISSTFVDIHRAIALTIRSTCCVDIWQDLSSNSVHLLPPLLYPNPLNSLWKFTHSISNILSGEPSGLSAHLAAGSERLLLRRVAFEAAPLSLAR